MPSSTKHLSRAAQHLLASKRLQDDTDLLSWASVVLFYVARDLAHAVFDADPTLSDDFRHPTSHTNQDLAAPGTTTVIGRHYRRVLSPYRDLFSTSLAVRYEGKRVSEQQFVELREALSEVASWTRDELRRADRNLPAWLDELADFAGFSDPEMPLIR